MRNGTAEPRVFAPTHALITSCAILFAVPLSSFCADVIFIRSAEGSPQEQKTLEVSTSFYGLNLRIVTAGSASDDDLALRRTVQRPETVAVTIAANALPLVKREELLGSLANKPGGRTPLLILGITPETDPTLLQTWSGGTVLGCKRRAESRSHLRFAIGQVAGFTGQLTGIEMPAPSTENFYLVLAGRSKGLVVAKVRDDQQAVPVFIEATLQQPTVFLDSTNPGGGPSAAQPNENSMVGAFAEIAPTMMFIKYCGGEQAWHALHHYANLTIDDPSLEQPYGWLDYEGLLKKMELHNFHSTIAFIPWNYDRNELRVVSLIHNHPGRFSLAIHGDNHDHKEFTDYQSKSLDSQTFALRQALARMDRLQVTTGIPVDKVMVFPHSIAPEKTLLALKNYGYLATVNSTNVPMGSDRPPGPLFALRPITTLFGGLPSMVRYSVAVPIPDYFLSINEFLDNPLLFYCHHELFAGGMNAFDRVADQVNRIQPDTRWRGLGDIVKHCFLVKKRDPAAHDVLAFANTIELENNSPQYSTFYVKKMENDPAAVRSITVDRQACPFALRDGYLEFKVPIPAGQVRSVAVQYTIPISSSVVSVEHDSIRVYLLRRASDLRDNILYRSALGRAIIHSYYDDSGEPRPWHLIRSAFVVIAILFCIWVGGSIFIRRRYSA